MCRFISQYLFANILNMNNKYVSRYNINISFLNKYFLNEIIFPRIQYLDVLKSL